MGCSKAQIRGGEGKKGLSGEGETIMFIDL